MSQNKKGLFFAITDLTHFRVWPDALDRSSLSNVLI